MAANPQYILQPVKVSFMALSLLAAVAFNLLPWQDVRGVPDLVALVLVFWCVHQPRKMGIGIAWLLGLFMDAANGVLIGQHALAYAVLAYAAQGLHRRIQRFSLASQSVHVLVLLVGAQLVMLAVRMAAGGTFPGWSYLLGAVIAAALWPLATYVLLAPQRQAAEVDETRPI
jgi:rod shape-determining protein MreD